MFPVPTTFYQTAVASAGPGWDGTVDSCFTVSGTDGRTLTFNDCAGSHLKKMDSDFKTFSGSDTTGSRRIRVSWDSGNMTGGGSEVYLGVCPTSKAITDVYNGQYCYSFHSHGWVVAQHDATENAYGPSGSTQREWPDGTWASGRWIECEWNSDASHGGNITFRHHNGTDTRTYQVPGDMVTGTGDLTFMMGHYGSQAGSPVFTITELDE